MSSEKAVSSHRLTDHAGCEPPQEVSVKQPTFCKVVYKLVSVFLQRHVSRISTADTADDLFTLYVTFFLTSTLRRRFFEQVRKGFTENQPCRCPRQGGSAQRPSDAGG